MSTRSTRFLVVAALALLGYILVFERRLAPAGPQATENIALLPGLRPEAVTALEITVRTNQLMRAQRPAGGPWVITLPDPYPAQQEPIEALLRGLSSATLRTAISARDLMQQQGGPAAFGLEVPPARITLFEGSRRSELRIGAQSPLGKQLYVQRVGSDGAGVVEARLLTLLPENQDDWKDRSLANFERGAVDRLEARSEGAFYELQLDATNHQWRLTKPFPARANPMRVEALIRLIGEARVSGFVQDPAGIDLDSPGLHPPALELILGKGTNVVAAIRFGGAPSNRADTVYARIAPRTNVVLVSKEIAEHFRPPHTRFRETRLAPFDPAEATQIEVAGVESFTLKRQAAGGWTLQAPEPLAADPALVQRMLETLAGLQISDFVQEVVGDYSLFGLGPTNGQYTIRTGSANTAAIQLQLGKSYQGNRVYARRADEPSLYAVRQSDALQLPQYAYELRERQLWKFAPEEVVSVSISYRGQARKISRGPGGAWLVTPAYVTTTPALFDECLFRLGQLQALAWVARGEDKLPKLGFADVAHQLSIEVRQGEKTQIHTLNFGHASPWNTPYAAATLDGQPQIFGVPSSVYDPYELVLRELKLVSPSPTP